MLPKLPKRTVLFILLAALASFPGCVIHPGYPYDTTYYYDPYYPYYYGPNLYVPFSLEFHGDYGRGGHRGFGGHHGGGRRW